MVFFNNGFGAGPTGAAGTIQSPGGGSALTVTYGAAAPFSTDGAAVFYKGNNAVYLKAGLDGTPGDITGFISANCTDTTNYSVAQ